MTTPSATVDQQAADRIPVRIWSINGERDLVAIHFRHEDLKSCGLQDGDRLVLDINGAVARGDVCLDLKGPWLGTQKLKAEGWSHRRITDALRAVGVDNPSEHVALIVERNGIVLPAADQEEVQRRATALVVSGRLPDSPLGNPVPATVVRTVTDFARDPAVVARVLQLASGRCEHCECHAPFRRANGTPYLEVHHVQTLANQGADTVENAVALCPTCHRLLHHASAQDRTSALAKLRANVARLSPAPV